MAHKQSAYGETDWKCINTIRTLAVDMTSKANSGHPGAPMGLAPVAHVLFNKFMRFNPKNPTWINRDRFVLSYLPHPQTAALCNSALLGCGIRAEG